MVKRSKGEPTSPELENQHRIIEGKHSVCAAPAVAARGKPRQTAGGEGAFTDGEKYDACGY